MLPQDNLHDLTNTLNSWYLNINRDFFSLSIEPYQNIQDTLTVYHYTSNEGFIGIINSKQFYASHFKYLNDTEELLNLNKALTQELNNYEHDFRAFIANPEHLNSRCSYFITSFGILGDSLNQWRNYTKGNGVSIGLTRSRIINISHNFPVPTTFGFCIYDDEKKIAIIKKVLQEINKFYIQIIQESKFSKGKLLLLKQKFGWVYNLLCCFSKHMSFIDEREVRIVITVPPNKDELILRRTGQFGNTPYVLFPYKDPSGQFIVDEIYIGPTNKTSIDALKTKLSSNSVIANNIKKSVIPYRE